MVRKWHNQKEIPIPKTEMRKNLINAHVLIQRKHIVSGVNSYFPIGGHTITQTLLKYEYVHKCKQHKNIQHQNIK